MNLAASFGVSIDRHQEDRHRGSHELLRPNCCDHLDSSFCASRDVGLRYRVGGFPKRRLKPPKTPRIKTPSIKTPGSGGDGDGAASSARAANASRVGSQRCVTQNTEDGTPATVIDDRDAEGILGKNVYSAANEDMGRVVDVIVKRTGEVRAAVIDFGGFLGVGSRTIAVDWSALRFPTSGPMDHIILELTRDQVRLAPEYKPGEPLVVLGLGDVQPHPETPAPEH